MWYKINYNQLGILMLPTFLRKGIMVSFVQVLLKPIGSCYTIWHDWRLKNIYKIEHSGQICYLRKSLNDDFDTVSRRIRIGEGNLNNTTYIYTEVEDKITRIFTESENKIFWLRTESETADTGFDFIVWVPAEVYRDSFFGLDAHIKFYKAGGKRYKILIDE
ncbi:hypothetical protein OIU80_19930 [Flavobacterium sp. LS1R47]|uniref:Uncharacterized protein n=1 Tax=Flavobacterium frigoritolerans TaxID=2987686 RepID=A0A9X3CAI6_9FLAO|nr:hypothetical protein [Flavobacterium frigoritolerans]MCV9934557.1 hypothetical protein [Flavobacterium frigoritolerans]